MGFWEPMSRENTCQTIKNTLLKHEIKILKKVNALYLKNVDATYNFWLSMTHDSILQIALRGYRKCTYQAY